jgi:hypothetical protein
MEEQLRWGQNVRMVPKKKSNGVPQPEEEVVVEPQAQAVEGEQAR